VTYPGQLVVPQLALAEVTYLLQRLDADYEIPLLHTIAIGDLIAAPVDPSDWMRIAQLVDEYHDLPLGSADASLVALAERLNVRQVASIDNDFRVVRPLHVEHFEVLPAA